jgi:hypothetical protein
MVYAHLLGYDRYYNIATLLDRKFVRVVELQLGAILDILYRIHEHPL